MTEQNKENDRYNLVKQVEGNNRFAGSVFNYSGLMLGSAFVYREVNSPSEDLFGSLLTALGFFAGCAAYVFGRKLTSEADELKLIRLLGERTEVPRNETLESKVVQTP